MELMEFVAIWLGTIVISYAMDFANELRMFKDIADAGYKLDTKKVSEVGNQFNPNASKSSRLMMLTPGFNIINAFKTAIEYNDVRPMLLDSLNMLGVIEEMTDLEKEEYAKKPTGLNAMFLPVKVEYRIAKASTLKINYGEETSKIFYEMGDSLDDITILRVEGDLSNLTVAEQKEMVIEAWKSMVEAGLEEYGDVETLKKEMNNSNSFELSPKTNLQKDEKSDNSELSADEKIHELEKLKNDLLEENKSSQGQKTDDGPRLIKKRKRKK